MNAFNIADILGGEMRKYGKLCSPLQIGGVVLKNRMLSAPTSLAELGPDEHYSPANIAYYRLKAMGGCSLVTVGDVIVDLNTGRSHPQQVGINQESSIPYLIEVADVIHKGGAKASIELDHGGALCSPEFLEGRQPIGPSSYIDSYGVSVRAMTKDEIEKIAEDFGKAALAAKKCGFDMVMIHAGHGWLIHQFLSPVTNHRTDEWGGSIENRMRFMLLVVEKVRASVGKNFPIEIRISGAERFEGGYSIDTGIEIAKALDGKVDLIHVSAGSQKNPYSAVLMHPGIFQSEGENSKLAKKIKANVNTPVCSVGAFSDPDFMESFLEEDGADCIAMGRALIADPFFPKKITGGKEREILPCIRCGECQSSMIEKHVMRCSVNPFVGREEEAINRFIYKQIQQVKRGICIVGGGPAGLWAAIGLAELGYRVDLYEEKDILGGALNHSDFEKFKYGIRRYRDFLLDRVKKIPVKLHMGEKVDLYKINELHPDVLIWAAGGTANTLDLPGINEAILATDYKKIEDLAKELHTFIIVGGGLVGTEMGLDLARKGCKVFILEMGTSIVRDAGWMHKINILHQVEVQENMFIYKNACCKEIKDNGVIYSVDGEDKFLSCDHVILATGFHADIDLHIDLYNSCDEVYIIGDAKNPGNIMTSISDAQNAIEQIDLGI